MNRMRMFNFYIDCGLFNKFKLICDSSGLSLSCVVRDLISSYVRQHSFYE